MIYLDYNATAPMRPEVIKAMSDVMHRPNNPSAAHKAGRTARLDVERARTQIANSVNGKTTGVIFTSGATEANNMIMNGFPDHALITTAIEHPATLKACKDIIVLPVDENGLLDLAVLERRLKDEKRPALVSIMMVNNQTGVIQPIKDIAKIVHEHGGLFHSDCAQSLGRMPIDMVDMGIDMLSIAGHKICGPLGIGALVIDPKLEIMPYIRGAKQENSRRAGTENVPAIIGFGIAADIAVSNIDHYTKLEILRDKLETEIKAISPEVIIHSKDAPRAANTSMFSLVGIRSDTMMMHMDLADIAISTGSACSSGRVEPSHVLTAMGCSEDVASSALRISMGCNTQESDIDAFITAWKTLYDRVGSRLKTG